MDAVIETGGKQYPVAPGGKLAIEKIPGAVGERVEFDRVLMVRKDGEVRIGTPVLERARVVGEIVAHGRGEKITVFKKKRRKNYRRTQGHRQAFTQVKILEIQDSSS